MKTWLKSKTIWVNLAVTILGGIITMVQSAPFDPAVIGIAVTILGAVNVYLRTITDTAIGTG